MGFYCVEKFLNLNILVGRTNVAGKRPIDVSRHITISPQSRIRTTEAHDWLRLEASQRLRVLLDVPYHFPVGIAPTGGCVFRDLVQFLYGNLGVVGDDFFDLGHYGLFVEADRQTNVGLKDAFARYHVGPQPPSDFPDVDRHLLDNLRSTLAHRLVDDLSVTTKHFLDISRS